MKFWDSSAIVPLVVPESSTGEMLSLYQDDPQILVWLLTPVEILSALCRKLREGTLERDNFRHFRDSLNLLGGDWSEITGVEQVRTRALRVLEVHPLRAADALQLSAALVATADRPSGFPFVTCDHLLAEAADKEGFTVLPSLT